MRFTLTIAIFLISLNCSAQFVRINEKDSSANEPTIAISKVSAHVMVAASNLNWIYYTEDGGKNWNSYRLESSLGFYGDPVLHAAHDGTFYLVHLSKTPGKQWGAWFDRIVFQKSTDGGKTFTDGVGIGFNGDKTQDKPWISADDQGNIYLTWTEFDKYGSDSAHHKSKIMFSKSNDQGDSWSKPKVISDVPGGCLDDDNTLEGATSTIGLNGEIYVVWSGAGKLYMDKSTNKGITFGKDQVIADQEGGWVLDIPHLYRTNGMPFIQYSPQGLYIVYTTKVGDQNKLQVWREEDHGEGRVRRLYPEATELLPGQQFFPNIAVDPENGEGVIGYYTLPDQFEGDFAVYRTVRISKGHFAFNREEDYFNLFALPDKNIFFGDYSDVDIHGKNYATIHASFTPGSISSQGSMNIMVYSSLYGGDAEQKYSFTPVIRDGYIGVPVPPRSKLKIRVYEGTKTRFFKSVRFVYDNQSDAWMYEKIPLNEYDELAYKSVLKYKISGTRFKTKLKHFAIKK